MYETHASSSLRVSHAKNLSVEIPFNGTYNKTSYEMRARTCYKSGHRNIPYGFSERGTAGQTREMRTIIDDSRAVHSVH